MWKNALGQPLVKQVTVMVIPPEGHAEQTRVFRSGTPKTGYNPSQIDDLIGLVTDWLDKTYPYWEFRMVEIGRHREVIKFIYAGLRERPGPAVINLPTGRGGGGGGGGEVPDAG